MNTLAFFIWNKENTQYIIETKEIFPNCANCESLGAGGEVHDRHLPFL